MSDATYKQKFGPDPDCRAVPCVFHGLAQVPTPTGRTLLRADITVGESRRMVIPDRVMVCNERGEWSSADPTYDTGSTEAPVVAVAVAKDVDIEVVRECRGCRLPLEPSGKRGRPAVYHTGCRPA